MKYTHILWDFDGTLFDTYPAMSQAFKHALKDFDIDGDIDEISRLMKVTLKHAKEHYIQKHNLSDDFSNRFDKLRTTYEEEYAVPYKNITELCSSISNSGSYNYLYTHRGLTSVYFLGKFNMAQYFTEFVTSENKFPMKPNPDAIEYLVKKYNMDTNRSIMIGDRSLDILAGKNAGIHSCFFNEDGKTCQDANYNISDWSMLSDIL